jgi:hypothetical protein
MNSHTKAEWRAQRLLLRLALVLALVAGWTVAHAYAGPGALRAKYDELRDELRRNAFGRALHVDSSERGDILKGDVYAVLDHPFSKVRSALAEPHDWCDVLLLPFNTKYCRAAERDNGAAMLQVRIGRKYDQPVQDAYRLDFALQPVAARPDYFESRLAANSGPVGTRDYRITVSAVPIDGNRTFMHFSYSYGYGIAGKLAMQGYLATAGADKVGFSVVGRDGAGQPIYIGGVRGAIERTAMRYYLAIDAHLAALGAPSGQQVEKRIETWFRETERYPRQLREMDRSTYVTMKRAEYERQQHALGS